MLFAILAVALVLRVGAAVAVQHYLDGIPDRNFLIPGDAKGYWQLAQEIAAGEEYAIHDPPRRIMRMPGFPALLALAGGNFYFARLMLAVVGTVACGLAYLLGRELIDETAGLFAAAITAVTPSMIVFSVLILSETAFAATMMLSLLLMARLLRTEKHGFLMGALTGIAVALACYMRPSWLLFGPAFAVFLVARQPRSRSAWLTSAAIPAGMTIALLPWAIRNDRVCGKPIVTTLWVGPSLYDGLNPNANGDSDMTFFNRDRLLDTMTEYDVDRHYRRLAWEFVRENPGRAVELGVVKLGRFWSPWPNAAQFRNGWIIAGTTVFFLLMMLPAVLGAWRMRRHWGKLLLTAGPVLYFSAIHAVFVGSIRYRLPAEYALCVLTGLGLSAAWGALRKSGNRRVSDAKNVERGH